MLVGDMVLQGVNVVTSKELLIQSLKFIDILHIWVIEYPLFEIQYFLSEPVHIQIHKTLNTTPAIELLLNSYCWFVSENAY